MSILKEISIDIGTAIKNKIDAAFNISTASGTYYKAYKQGKVVSVYIDRTSYSPAEDRLNTWINQGNLPDGFKPRQDFYMEYDPFRVRITSAGAIEVNTPIKGINLIFNFTYVVE